MSNNDLIIKPKRAKGEDGYRVFSVRLREELIGQIDDIVLKTGRSRNELIGVFLEYAVKNCKVES